MTERPRKMGPVAADDWLITDKTRCSACNGHFTAGDYVTLVALGPGPDAENRAKARAGRAYNAVAVPVHWACATGEEDLTHSPAQDT